MTRDGRKRQTVVSEFPLHNRSLAGVLRQYAEGIIPPTDAEIDDIVGSAIAEEWRRQEAAGDFGG